MNENVKRWRENNKDRAREIQRRWVENNPGWFKEYNKRRYRPTIPWRPFPEVRPILRYKWECKDGRGIYSDPALVYCADGSIRLAAFWYVRWYDGAEDFAWYKEDEEGDVIDEKVLYWSLLPKPPKEVLADAD